jgi:hypothetical protein
MTSPAFSSFLPERVVHLAAMYCKEHRTGYIRPLDLCKTFGMTRHEAYLALWVASLIGYPVKRRRGGWWFWDNKHANAEAL